MIPLRNTQLNNRFTPQVNQQRPGGMGANPFGVNMQMPIPNAPVGQQIPQQQMPFTMNGQPVPQRNFGQNPPVDFGQTTQAPLQIQGQQPDPTQVPGINGGQQPVDFAGEYAKLNANRPNRLAYQQSIEQGSPEIKRGKWAKLGAMIAAAGGSMGYGSQPGGAQAGANLGLSSYYAPQERADAAFEKKQKGLGNLASMEEQDIANQIKALEAKQQDYYRNREDVRQQTESTRQGEESKLRMKSAQDEMDRRDLTIFTNPKTGMTYRKNIKTGEAVEIGQGELTQAEQIELERQKEEARVLARKPEKDADRAMQKYGIDVGYEGKIDTAEIRAEQAKTTAAARLAAAAKKLPPGDVYGNTLNAMSQAVSADDLSPEAAALIRKNEALGNLEVAPTGYLGNKKYEREAKAWLAEELARQTKPPAAAAAAPAGAGTTQSGRKYQVTPVGGGGR